MDAVVLENKTRQAMTISLDHEQYCRFSNACGCSRGVVTTKVRPGDGSPAGTQQHRRRHPAIVTLMPGETSRPLHPAVLRVPQVVTGMERGLMSATRVAVGVDLAASDT